MTPDPPKRLGSLASARLMFYSHDAQRLGHIRRNLNIANSLVEAGLDVTVLLVCGSRKVSGFQVGRSIDTLILPALSKHTDGAYRPRSLGIDHSQLLEFRRQTILAAAQSFKPDILIVDKQPLGFQGELLPALELVRKRGGRSILGLRDIIDTPEVARAEWEQAGGDDAVLALYDSIWIYGDRSVYDLTKDYRFSDALRLKTWFTGYLNPLDLMASATSAKAEIPESPRKGQPRNVLCLVGGGQDGYQLSNLFLKSDLGKNQRGILVTGPYMSENHRFKLAEKARKRGDFQVHTFFPSLLPLMRKADLVVSLGGYNTVCELLALGIPSLIIPRIVPRQEQLIRAQLFQELGLLSWIHPESVTREAISTWVQQKDHRQPNPASTINFSGFATVRRQVLAQLPSTLTQP
jgi:predicted glycosyltransferase